MEPPFARLWIGSIVAALVGAAGIADAPSRSGDSGLLERARAALAAHEYAASPTPEGLQAPNRAHGLRSYFAPDGVRVRDREESGEPLVGLTLIGVGRPGHLARVPEGRVTSQGARVEIRRDGLVEWYLNAPLGLEHGFDLAERPGGDGELVLELALEGARATAPAPDSIQLASASGRTLRYGGLRADDADGRALAARLEVPDPTRIRLVVADAGARYPIAIDPLLTSTFNSLLVSEQQNSWLGFGVASGCDVNGDGFSDVILGALAYSLVPANEEGAVFIFMGSANGVPSANTASPTATKLFGGQAGAYFGSSVACAGDVNGDGYEDVVVGAPDSDWAATPSSAGKAFMFLGSASGIANGGPATAATVLTGMGTGGVYANGFGQSVASAGDVNGDGFDDVVVGAVLGPVLSDDPGAAFVYHGSASGIASGGLAVAASRMDGTGTLHLGDSVSSAGDVNADGFDDVIVGASFAGTAFLFHGAPAGIPSGAAAAIANSTLTVVGSYWFGSAVAGAGDVNGDGYGDVIIGAPFGHQPGNVVPGYAFVFHGSATGVASGTTATAAATLVPSPPNAQFGWVVASAGDVNGDGYADVAVGSPRDPFFPSDFGEAVVWVGGPNGIGSGDQSSAWAAPHGLFFGAELGAGLGAAGDVNGDGYDDVIVGAPHHDYLGVRSGAAYVFLGGAASAKGAPSTAALAVQSNQADAGLGIAVASAGDVNADGFDDVIIGAPYYDLGQTDEGAVFIFHGGSPLTPLGDPNNAVTTLQSDQGGSLFGAAVASAGDVNGDGYADVVVGASLFNNGTPQEGVAFLFRGSATGVASGAPFNAAGRFQTNQEGAFGGDRVGGADVNGDGFSDVLVAASSFDFDAPPLSDEGAVFVLHGGVAGIGQRSPQTASTVLVGDAPGLRFGGAMAPAGDVNGDGSADLLVGAGGYSNNEFSEGAVFVFHGSSPLGIANGGPASAASRIESNRVNEYLAIAAAAGDVNGDGYDDVLVGSQLYSDGEANEGGAFLYLGGVAGIPTGSLTTSHSSVTSNQLNAQLGLSVAGAGDVNGDGFADVVVGAYLYTVDLVQEGASLVYHGRSDGLVFGAAAALLQGDQTGSGFGSSVAGAGDVNGDGFADVLVSAPAFDSPDHDEGTAYVFLGNRAGRLVRARQRSWGASNAVRQRGGLSTALDGFVTELTATHPGGRGLVAAEFETCPLGAVFGTGGCTLGVTSWATVGPTGLSALHAWLFTGLAANQPYRWRARSRFRDDTGPSAPTPRHGPWRRLQAAPARVDIHTDSDADLDLVANVLDNCFYSANPTQIDTGGFAPSGPDLIGNACQCGDVSGDGTVSSEDPLAVRNALANPTGAALSPAALERCTVFKTGSPCDIVQVVVLRRGTALPRRPPVTNGPAAQVCAAATP